MLRTIILIYAVVNSIFRGGILGYILINNNTNLPLVVIITTSVVVIFGVYLLIRRIIRSFKLRSLMFYCIVTLVAFTFNLLYIALSLPIQLNFLESLTVGSILDIILCIVFLGYIFKEARSKYVSIDTKSLLDQKEEN